MKTLLIFTLVALACSSTARAKEESVALFVQAIVGTNRDQEPAGERWKKVGPKLRHDLSPVFKWKHYWEVSCRKVELKPGKLFRIQLTKERDLEVQIFADGRLELRMFRGGKPVRTMKDIVAHRRVIMGGDSNTDEAWFVVVRRDKPSTE
ncbi:MAG: hypothetical protein L0Y58_06500 [Verrucomicrobia subdivision 3 bacterium]|nr:hypothetical protein [Limisphaerales bacterium]